jgi:hypothetical protein
VHVTIRTDAGRRGADVALEWEAAVAANRHIRKVVKSRPTIEGAGVHLRRAIGLGPPELTDPFLLLDDFRSDDRSTPSRSWTEARSSRVGTDRADGAQPEESGDGERPQ